MRAAVAGALALALGCAPAPAPVDGGRLPDAPATPEDGGARDDVGSDAAALDAARSDAPGADGGGAVTTTIRVVYEGDPGAITFRGAGGPLSWTADLAATDHVGSVWVLETTEIMEPMEWKPLLDGEWARGANYHVEPGATIEVSPHFTASTGRLVVVDPSFDSAFLAANRRVAVFLPAGYDENVAARYPVVYAQDGQNLFDAAMAFGGTAWEVDETLDAASESGRCLGSETLCTNDGDCGPARCESFELPLVVAVDNTADRIAEYTPTSDPSYGGGMADAYLRALVEEVRPRIDAAYRTRTDAASTAILGSSLGGLLAAHASVVRPGDFGVIVAMSPSTWWDSLVILDEVATITSPRSLRVYVDSGDAGSSSDGVADTAMLADAYRALGYVDGTDFDYRVAPGHQHSEYYWALRLPGALSFALGPRERVVP